MIDVLHLVDLAGKDDDAAEVALLEHLLNDLQFLRLMADVGRLLDFLGRLADGNLHFDGILEQCLGQLLYLVGHRSREHDRLAGLGQVAGYLQDVVGEAHVEHTVGLVEYKEADAAHVDVAHGEVRDEASRCGDDDRCARLQRVQFLVVSVSVVTAIDSHGIHVGQVIAESLHGLVNLLSKFTRGCHDDAVDGV